MATLARRVESVLARGLAGLGGARAVLAVTLAIGTGCDETAPPPIAYFATDAAAHASPDTFWNAPFPAAWRLTEAGAPDLTGYPLGGSDALANLAQNVATLRGVPVIANVYFRLQAMPTAVALATRNQLSPVMTTTTAGGLRERAFLMISNPWALVLSR